MTMDLLRYPEVRSYISQVSLKLVIQLRMAPDLPIPILQVCATTSVFMRY